MLGSTAVAKQLLREIADKLVADNIAPEALFVRLGMAVRKKECALWNENQYDISGNFFSKHNFFQSESNVPQCVLSKERQRTIWWPALACPVIFTWHDLLSSIRKIACTTRLLCLVCPSYHIVVPISPILHSKRPSFESRLTSRIFIVYVTVGRGECAKLLFVFFYVLHFHKLQACFNMVPVCFFFAPRYFKVKSCLEYSWHTCLAFRRLCCQKHFTFAIGTTVAGAWTASHSQETKTSTWTLLLCTSCALHHLPNSSSVV